MLLSIGNVRSTTRVNFSLTGAWANPVEAVPMMPSAKDSKTNRLAFIIIVISLPLLIKGGDARPWRVIKGVEPVFAGYGRAQTRLRQAIAKTHRGDRAER